jgi:hypothetical protein
MTATEKWNKIVKIYNKHLNEKEEVVQSVWEDILIELFGYSRLDREVESHRTIQIGATERTIPDIIVKSGDADLFVLELKQLSKLLKQGMEVQLFSYLKQLKNDVGVLICDKIYIYDYVYEKNDAEQDKAEIEFVIDNPDGAKFVEMFCKSTFSRETISRFIQEQINSIAKTELIKKELTSELIASLLKKHFVNEYGEVEFKRAFDGIKISISSDIEDDESTVISQPNTKTSDSPSATVANNNENTLKGKNKVAKQICLSKGIEISNEYAFASLNRDRGAYWVNPPLDYLLNEWFLILNDYTKNELHIFRIPANSIPTEEMRIRNDAIKQNCLDLSIKQGAGNSFVDMYSKSKVEFSPWYVKTIEYS